MAKKHHIAKHHTTKFKRSPHAAEVYNFQHYMDNFYLEKSTLTLIDAIRALRLVPPTIRMQSRAVHNFEKTATKFCRRIEVQANMAVGDYVRSLVI